MITREGGLTKQTLNGFTPLVEPFNVIGILIEPEFIEVFTLNSHTGADE